MQPPYKPMQAQVHIFMQLPWKHMQVGVHNIYIYIPHSYCHGTQVTLVCLSYDLCMYPIEKCFPSSYNRGGWQGHTWSDLFNP